MRFIRFRADINAGSSNLINSKVTEMKGIYDKDTGMIRRIHGSIFLGYSVTDEVYSLSDVTAIAPVSSYTIICLDKIDETSGQGSNGSKSYLKSASSLGGAGSVVKIQSGMDGVYCSPRLAYVVEPRGKAKIFGHTLMLDFSTHLTTNSYMDSGVNYTVLGEYVNAGGNSSSTDARLVVNDSAVEEIKVNAPKIDNDIFNKIAFVSGDIVAINMFNNKILCRSGDKIEFTYLGMSVSAVIE